MALFFVFLVSFFRLATAVWQELRQLSGLAATVLLDVVLHR